jgi:hypothetical protein
VHRACASLTILYMRRALVNQSHSRALHSLRYRVLQSNQCAIRLHAALHRFPHTKVTLHRNSKIAMQQYLHRVLSAYLPRLIQQTTGVPNLSDASTWRMLISDNSLVAWYRIREQCTVASTLSSLVLQREQLPVSYRLLVSTTTQELMSVLFVGV